MEHEASSSTSSALFDLFSALLCLTCSRWSVSSKSSPFFFFFDSSCSSSAESLFFSFFAPWDLCSVYLYFLASKAFLKRSLAAMSCLVSGLIARLGKSFSFASSWQEATKFSSLTT